MGADWIMQLRFHPYDHRGAPQPCFLDFMGGKGMYVVTADDEEDETKRQMVDWNANCPDATIYENGRWFDYNTPEWYGVTIQYDKMRIIALVGNLDNVGKIVVRPNGALRH